MSEKTPTCPVCRGPMPERPAGSHGRPPAFCGPACRRMATMETQRINRRLFELESSLSREAVEARLGEDPSDVNSREYRAEHRRKARALEARIDAETARLRELLERIGTTSPSKEDP